MSYLLILVTGIVVSLGLIPVMVRLAPRLGLIDRPDARKVHAKPIPRVGGIGIVLGAVAAVALTLSIDTLVMWYLFGTVVLAAFGLWDDRIQIGHYRKFVGQTVAASGIVFGAGLYVQHFPLIADGTVPQSLAMGLTLLAIIGMVNAVNHSDGLDGLAGGEALVSFCVIGALAYAADGKTAVLLAIAAVGGLYGFIRYNVHPARVFMGDTGSQFLGFTLGVLLILLTQHADTTLSPAVVLLLAGVPVIDILVVLGKRIRSGGNWFLATKNHVHHRLLALGFSHGESVVVIYAFHLTFIFSGVVMRHSPDELILIWYGLLCTLLFGSLAVAERRGWQAEQSRLRSRLRERLKALRTSHWTVVLPRRFLALAIPCYLLLGAFTATAVPLDFGIIAIIMAITTLLDFVLGSGPRSFVRRTLVYATAAVIVYLGHGSENSLELADMSFFASLGVMTLLAVISSPRRRRSEFNPTPLDYLILLSLFAAVTIVDLPLTEGGAAALAIKTIVILYACELLLAEKRVPVDALSLTALAAMAVLSIRGLL